jgi:hypothetical protein
MPPTREHVETAQRLANLGAGLIPEDGAQKEALPRHLAHVPGRSEHRRKDDRVAVQLAQWVVVVELEPQMKLEFTMSGAGPTSAFCETDLAGREAPMSQCLGHSPNGLRTIS